MQITRRSFLASAAAAAAGAQRRPNVLLVLSDQQHWRAMGAMDRFFETPHLDALAAGATLFERSFCTTPQCSPSRSSLLTGCYPSRTRVFGNIGALGGNPLAMPTLGAMLQEAGYYTGYFGKWHLGGEASGNAGWNERNTEKAFVRARLAEPLGWGRWGWGYSNVGLTHTPGGGGIAPRATDMLRFGYLLLRNGRWKGRQIVPAEFVRDCGRITRFNPHYPESLTFVVNGDGHVPNVPRDAFWKQGSGGHCIYVVPSLDLVVWKLGGRDEQYSPKQVRECGAEASRGLKPAALPEYDGSRDNWKAGPDAGAAATKTLQMVAEVW